MGLGCKGICVSSRGACVAFQACGRGLRAHLCSCAQTALVMAAPEGSLRKRQVGGAAHSPASPPSSLARDPTDSPARLHTGTFWLTRVVLLRALAFIYCECPVGAGCRRHPVT